MRYRGWSFLYLGREIRDRTSKTQAFKSGCPLLEAFLFPSSTVGRTTYVAQTTATQLLPIQDSAGCIHSERKPHQTDKHYGWQQLMPSKHNDVCWDFVFCGLENETMCRCHVVSWDFSSCRRNYIHFFPNRTMCAPSAPNPFNTRIYVYELSSDFFPHTFGLM